MSFLKVELSKIYSKLSNCNIWFLKVLHLWNFRKHILSLKIFSNKLSKSSMSAFWVLESIDFQSYNVLSKSFTRFVSPKWARPQARELGWKGTTIDAKHKGTLPQVVADNFQLRENRNSRSKSNSNLLPSKSRTINNIIQNWNSVSKIITSETSVKSAVKIVKNRLINDMESKCNKRKCYVCQKIARSFEQKWMGSSN